MSFLSSNSTFLKAPLEQFEVLDLLVASGWSPIIFTNVQFFLIFTILLVILYFYNYNQLQLWIPLQQHKTLYLLELVYNEVIVIVFRNVGYIIGQLYFPILFFIFLIITSLNLVGIIPYAFTITSHIVVTFCFSFLIFVGINIRSILDKQTTFFSLFLPSGAPLIIAPFLVIIEIISYVARVFSLAIRLFANIMAGHTLLKILIGFAFLIAGQGFQNNWTLLFVALIPFLIVYIITFLEVAIALLQGYVFTVLLCLYIKDLYVSH